MKKTHPTRSLCAGFVPDAPSARQGVPPPSRDGEHTRPACPERRPRRSVSIKRLRRNIKRVSAGCQNQPARARALPFFLPLLLLLLGTLLALPAHAEQFGDFTYSSNSSAITITGYTGAGGTVTIPGTIDGIPVRTIGERAFQNKSTLTNVNIPSSVIDIESLAFSGSGLTSVTIPNSVTSIGGGSLNHCDDLAVVNIGNGVTSIESSAFSGCTGLTNVTMGSSLATIGDFAFSRCTGLTSVAIPASVTSIGDNAFHECFFLQMITVAADNPAYSSADGVLFDKGQTALIQYPEGKSGAYVIPGSVTRIKNWAFQSSASLTSVTIPSSLTTIESPVAFAYCKTLLTIEVAADNPVYSSVDGVLFNKNQTTLLLYPGGKTGSYIIPSSVTSIGVCSFYSCTSLTNVTIPTGVTSIGGAAFSDCRNLVSVTIPASVTSIGDSAFRDCEKLDSATFEGNVPGYIGWDVFRRARLRGFTIYYYAGRTGFTSPTWEGYPSVMLGASSVPTLAQWREQHFGAGAANSGNAADNADPDGDGLTNVEEYAAGTDPKSAGSALKVASATKTGSTYTLTFDAQPGRRYELQRLLVTPGAAWQTVATQEPTTTAGSVSLTDPAAPADAALYRIKVVLP